MSCVLSDSAKEIISNFKVINPLSPNFTKWLNKLKQFVGNLLMNRLSVFDHFVKLALKSSKTSLTYCCKKKMARIFYKSLFRTTRNLIKASSQKL